MINKKSQPDSNKRLFIKNKSPISANKMMQFNHLWEI